MCVGITEGGATHTAGEESKHLQVTDECPRCCRGTKDSFHAVVVCPISNAVWDAVINFLHSEFGKLVE